MEKNCQQCNKVFQKPYTCSKNVWETYKHCSKACNLKSHPPKITKVCLECEGHFSVRNYRKETANFCSKECSWQYRDEGKRTADKKIRQSWAYKAWRTLVFERDNYTCVECGDKNYVGRGESLALHADHIKPFALYPELRFEPSNGRTLCVPCHKKTGTYGRGAIYRKKCIAVA
jgi:5-methylcytosine-specific restriction endonuclease McrA